MPVLKSNYYISDCHSICHFFCICRFGKTKIILGTALLAMIASNLSLTIVSPADEKQFFSDCHSSSIVEVDQGN